MTEDGSTSRKTKFGAEPPLCPIVTGLWITLLWDTVTFGWIPTLRCTGTFCGIFLRMTPFWICTLCCIGPACGGVEAGDEPENRDPCGWTMPFLGSEPWLLSFPPVCPFNWVLISRSRNLLMRLRWSWLLCIWASDSASRWQKNAIASCFSILIVIKELPCSFL